MRRLLALPLALIATAVLAEPTLWVEPVPGRVAKSEADWTWMVPMRLTRDEGPQDCDSPILHAQLDTPDKRTTYQIVCRWVTSDLIVAVDRESGKRRAVGPGNSLALILDGPYRGYLLVSRHLYFKRGGSYDPVQVVRASDGKAVLTVPGSDVDADAAVARWLGRHGWHMLDSQGP